MTEIVVSSIYNF